MKRLIRIILFCLLSPNFLLAQEADNTPTTEQQQQLNCDNAEVLQGRFGEAAKKRCEEVKEMIGRAKGSNPIGEDIAKKYSATGSKFNQGAKRYQRHPWWEDNPDWYDQWKEDSEFFIDDDDYDPDDLEDSCAQWEDIPGAEDDECHNYLKQKADSVLGGIAEYVGCCKGRAHDESGTCYSYGTPRAEEVWEHWRPENQAEANNFAIGAVQPRGRYRGKFQEVKEQLVNQELAKGLNRTGREWRPGGLLQDPHLGQSHLDGGATPGIPGFQKNYEVAITRTHWDVERTKELKDNRDSPYYVLKNCVPPLSRFAVHHTEEFLSAFWRIPELSATRDNTEAGAHELDAEYHKELLRLAGTPTFAYHGLTRLATTGGGPSLNNIQAGQKSLLEETCSSFWLKNAKDAYNEEFPLDKTLGIKEVSKDEEEWRKLCYHWTLGTLYPLTGVISTDASSIAPLLAIRRAFRWASWEIFGAEFDARSIAGAQGSAGAVFTEDVRSNYINDREGQNLYRDHKDTDGDTKLEERRGDKWQRIFPEPTPECFSIDSVHQRDPRHPPDLIKEEHLGSVRYAHWNRRKVCLCEDPCIEVDLTYIKLRFCIPVEQMDDPMCFLWEE